jgi:hypothetical protein
VTSARAVRALIRPGSRGESIGFLLHDLREPLQIPFLLLHEVDGGHLEKAGS